MPFLFPRDEACPVCAAGPEMQTPAIAYQRATPPRAHWDGVTWHCAKCDSDYKVQTPRQETEG